MPLLNEDLIDAFEAAKLLNVNHNTLRRWIDEGRRGVKLEAMFIGHRLRTSRQAVQRFLVRLNTPAEAGKDGQ